MRKVAQRRLEGLLRKAARADEGGKTKGVSPSPLRPGVLLGGGGVPRRNKGMKGRFALDALYPPHNDGSVVLGSVEACFFSRVFLVINTTCP